jgi:hypothetical protein
MREEVSREKVMLPDDAYRRRRRNETLYRKRRMRLAVGLAALCLVVAVVVIVAVAGGSTAQVRGNDVTGVSSSAAVVAASGSHPAIARLGDRNVLLPVCAEDVTIIAYQPVADAQSVEFSPIGEQTNANAVVRFFRGIFSGAPSVRYYLLDGKGNGPTGAALIGAAPGAGVFAPVSGTVIAVKHYKLYGKYDDVQIDIRPEEMSGITISLLFIDQPAVSIGDVVAAGKTPLGSVRECPSELAGQLSVFTHDGGAHVYMQATEEPSN